jgi:phage shock protein C
MHKTISLNLGGTVFHAEEPAFDLLSGYLTRIRSHFRNQEGGEEIIQDIEARLAELFSEHLQTSGTQAITETIVQTVLSEMGNPEDFTEGAEEKFTAHSNRDSFIPKGNRKLFRDPDDRILGGVCGGVGAYLGLDSVWVRLLFAILFFGFGTGFFVYLLLWIIIPAAKTTAEKLQMRGDPVNLDSINRFIRDEAVSLQAKAQSGAVRNSVSKGTDIMLNIFQILVRIVVYGLAAASVAVSLAVIIGLSIGLITLLFASSIPSENPMNLLLSQNQLFLGIATIFLLICIPFFWLLYKGISFLFKIPGPGVKTGYTLLLLWILGFVLAGFTATDVLKEYGSEAVVRKQDVVQVQDSTVKKYIIRGLPVKSKSNRLSFFGTSWSFHSNIESGKSLSSDDVSLSIEKSNNGQFEIWQVMKSRGRTEAEATLLAARSRLPITQQDSIILIPSAIELSDNKWRNQEVEIIIKVPAGVQVEFEPSVRKLWERSEENEYSWYDRRAAQRCEAGPGGITCTEFISGNSIQQGEGKIVEIDNFKEIEGDGDVKIIVRIGEAWKVQIMGDDREEVEVERSGDRLVLSSEEELEDDTYVLIDMPSLEKIKLSGAAEAELFDFSGDVLNLDCSGASYVLFKGKANRINSEGSGASKLVLNGSARSLYHEGSGASHLEAESLDAQQVDIQMSGAAHAEIKVIESLEAKSSGASSIVYSGNPTRVEKQKTGAGKISAR